VQQEAAALRDFNPVCVAFGSCASDQRSPTVALNFMSVNVGSIVPERATTPRSACGVYHKHHGPRRNSPTQAACTKVRRRRSAQRLTKMIGTPARAASGARFKTSKFAPRVRGWSSRAGEKIFTPEFRSPPVDHRRLIVEWLTL
jgi:hypothetical protein